jgi:hypothetical protein
MVLDLPGMNNKPICYEGHAQKSKGRIHRSSNTLKVGCRNFDLD